MLRKACKRYNSPGDAHHLTFSCYQRLPLLQSDRLREWLAESINSARESQRFDLWGYVFMPEHVHLLLCPLQDGYSISRILSAIKRPVAYRAIGHSKKTQSKLLAQLTSQCPDGTIKHHLWQAGGGYDRNLNTAKAIHEALDYIHNNPVHRGLVERADDWFWSSYGGWWGKREGRIRIDRKTLPAFIP